MKRIPVVSSMIRSVGYDEPASFLEIEFRSGKLYRYDDVPQEVYLELMSASSKGRYFEMHIKDAGFGYHRIW